jgi:hypothetical protein
MPRIPDDIVRDRFAAGKTDDEIADGFARVNAHYVFRRRMVLRLLREPGKKKGGPGVRKNSRHGSHTLDAGASMPAIDNAAFTEKRTIYTSTVVDVSEVERVLISGVNSRKIGAVITKGPAKGFPIYTLTLEERATCPTSCHHWRSCFGNNLHHSKRLRHGPEFEARLEAELAILQSRHPGGFAVRLHVLGDFYSVEYVELWRRFLLRFRSLFVFGFTARWERSDPIAIALLLLVTTQRERFAIRFSNAPVDEDSTVSIEHPIQKPADAIICPAQTGKTESCGSCGLCWHSRRRIAFLQHAIVGWIGGWLWLAVMVT